MADAKEHYDRVLFEFYSWMFGGFEAGVRRNVLKINIVRANLMAQSRVYLFLNPTFSTDNMLFLLPFI